MANLTKDQRLIKENPDKSAYELKEMGLSDKGFTDLLAKQAEGKEAPEVKEPEPTPEPPEQQSLPALQDVEKKLTDALAAPVPAKVTIIPARATPQTQPAKPMHVAEGQAHLVEKKSGKRTYMSRVSAERWAKKHPGKYQVI